ncbi:MAG: DUF3572 family protein [Rhizobiales bacterium]|nr:DUF3572 family protein [Hyphomicrobiales bacterium]
MNRDSAELIAIQALGFLAGDEDLLGAFLDLSGLAGDELRERATEPAFLVSVLDFILMEDERVLRFCESTGMDPQLPAQARRTLPGGEVVEWT